MPGMRCVASLLLLFAILLGGLLGCGNDDEAAPAGPKPSLGAPRPVPSATPHEAMDDLEQPVAHRLAPRLLDDGLTLQYVECPRWSGAVPVVLECKGYVDGVVGTVVVELSRRTAGRVEFDARLEEGVLAVRRLEQRLERGGYTGVDCGGTRAYPARAGMRISCTAHKGEHLSHVVATVVDRRGAVRIEDY